LQGFGGEIIFLIKMPIIKWLENNFPTLVDFFGKEFIQTIFTPAEEFLSLSPSEDKILEYLDKECINTRFKNMVWWAYFNFKSPTATAEIAKRELEILEDSLKVLVTQIGESKLSSIREKLKDPANMWQGLHEAYVASRLCTIAEDIELEVPNPDRQQNNFDIKANINGTEINIEVTTRTDYFPFDRTSLNRVDNIGPARSRATVPPDFAEDDKHSSPTIQHDSIPESEDLRRKLLDKAKKQLPKDGINVIALGYRGTTNADFHITNALYGDPKYGFYKSLSPEERKLFINRVKNGLCCEEDFKHISAVMLISPYTNDGKLYLNSNSDKRLLSSVQESLVEIFKLEVVEQGG